MRLPFSSLSLLPSRPLRKMASLLLPLHTNSRNVLDLLTLARSSVNILRVLALSPTQVRMSSFRFQVNSHLRPLPYLTSLFSSEPPPPPPTLLPSPDAAIATFFFLFIFLRKLAMPQHHEPSIRQVSLELTANATAKLYSYPTIPLTKSPEKRWMYTNIYVNYATFSHIYIFQPMRNAIGRKRQNKSLRLVNFLFNLICFFFFSTLDTNSLANENVCFVFVWLQRVLLHSNGEIRETSGFGRRQKCRWLAGRRWLGNLSSPQSSLQPQQPHWGMGSSGAQIHKTRTRWKFMIFIHIIIYQHHFCFYHCFACSAYRLIFYVENDNLQLHEIFGKFDFFQENIGSRIHRIENLSILLKTRKTDVSRIFSILSLRKWSLSLWIL